MPSFILNVKAFGAVGNGSIDDRAAIQAAVNAAIVNGGTVYFPVGTYKISNNITFPAGVKYKFDTGAELLPDSTKILTFNGTIEADPQSQIFGGSGTVVVNTPPILNAFGTSTSSLVTTLVYQPGGVAAGNVFTDFNALYKALDVLCPVNTHGGRSPSIIQIDGYFVSNNNALIYPRTGGGAYNLNNVTWEGVASAITGSGGSEVTFQDGVTINGGSPSANLTMRLRGNIEFVNNTTNNVISCAYPNQVVLINMNENANMQSDTTGRMLKCTNGGIIYIFMSDDATLGDGISPVIENAGGAGVEVQAYGHSFVGGNSLTGSGISVFWDFASPGPIPGVTVTSVICTDTSVTLSNGANQNVAIPDPLGDTKPNAFVRIDGPTSSYSIGGIVCNGGNRPGTRVTFWSANIGTLSLNNADAGSIATNQIYTKTGSAVTVGGTFSTVTLQYAAVIPGWVVVGSS